MLKNGTAAQRRQVMAGRSYDDSARESVPSRRKAEPASIRRTVRSDRQDSIDGTSVRVLVVDFHAAILDIVAMMFKAIGCRVSTANSCDAAVTSLAKMPFDLVVSEFSMSKLDGCQLAARVKAVSPRTKVLIMTGLCQSEVAAEMGSPDVDGWIFKPFGFDELLDVLELIELPEACPCIRA
jgi:CheY-like chemotaxis protein